MRFRMGLALGFGIGYVMGSKAGRARYDQIRTAGARVWDSSPGQRVRETAHEVVETVGSKGLDVLRSLTSGRPDHIDLTTDEDGNRPIGRHLS